MKLSTSKILSFIIALTTSFILALCCKFLLNIDDSFTIILSICSFLVCYTTSFILIEFVIFTEIKKVYQKVMSSEENYQALTYDQQNINFNHLGTQITSFAERKNKELKKMKDVETFRRQFLADIAHELKTPIHIAQGYLENLIDGAIDDMEVRDKFLDKTSKALDHLDHVIKDLINISQLETGEIKLAKQPINLVELSAQILYQFEEMALQKKSNLIFNSNQKSVIALVDKIRIEQVFTNLLANALRYGGDGIDITLTIESDGNKVRISVEDNGQGIDKSHHQKIFNRFYRIEKSRSKQSGGSGLGLAIVKHIIDVHGSSIQLESEIGKGSKFYFELPIFIEKSA